MSACSYTFSAHCHPSNLVQFCLAPVEKPVPRASKKSSRVFFEVQQSSLFKVAHSGAPALGPSVAQESALGISPKLQRSSEQSCQLTPNQSPEYRQAHATAPVIPETIAKPAPSSLRRTKPKVARDVYKAKQFTRKARLAILDAGGALEKEGYAPDDFVFFTGTLPGSTKEAMETIAKYSRDFVNILKQKLRRLGIYETINTWEFQKRGALHLHLILVCTDKNLRDKLPEILKDKWMDIIDLVSKKSSIDLYARKDGGAHHRLSKSVKDNCVKTIICSAEKGSSPVSYLSKYVGKGAAIPDKQVSAKNQHFKEGGLVINSAGVTVSTRCYPSSWWSVSSKVRQLVNKHLVSFSVKLPCEKAMELFIEISNMFSFDNICNLALNPFSLPLHPDYTYRNIYLKPEYFLDLQTSLKEMFDWMNEEYGVKIARGRISTNVALEWLNLPERRNVKLKHKFINHYLAFHTTGLANAILYYDFQHKLDKIENSDGSLEVPKSYAAYLKTRPECQWLEPKAKRFLLPKLEVQSMWELQFVQLPAIPNTMRIQDDTLNDTAS